MSSWEDPPDMTTSSAAPAALPSKAPVAPAGGRSAPPPPPVFHPATATSSAYGVRVAPTAQNTWKLDSVSAGVMPTLANPAPASSTPHLTSSYGTVPTQATIDAQDAALVAQGASLDSRNAAFQAAIAAWSAAQGNSITIFGVKVPAPGAPVAPTALQADNIKAAKLKAATGTYVLGIKVGDAPIGGPGFAKAVVDAVDAPALAIAPNIPIIGPLFGAIIKAFPASPGGNAAAATAPGSVPTAAPGSGDAAPAGVRREWPYYFGGAR